MGAITRQLISWPPIGPQGRSGGQRETGVSVSGRRQNWSISMHAHAPRQAGRAWNALQRCWPLHGRRRRTYPDVATSGEVPHVKMLSFSCRMLYFIWMASNKKMPPAKERHNPWPPDATTASCPRRPVEFPTALKKTIPNLRWVAIHAMRVSTRNGRGWHASTPRGRCTAFLWLLRHHINAE